MKKLITVLLILSLMCPVWGSLAEETKETEGIPSLWLTQLAACGIRIGLLLFLPGYHIIMLNQQPSGADIRYIYTGKRMFGILRSTGDI